MQMFFDQFKGTITLKDFDSGGKNIFTNTFKVLNADT